MESLQLYQLLLPLLAIVVPLLCLNRAVRRRRHHEGAHLLPPSLWALPVIGHLHHLVGDLPHRAMRDLARRHGPLLLLRLGGLPVVVASSADAAREVMVARDVDFATRPISRMIRLCIPEGAEGIVFAREEGKGLEGVEALDTEEALEEMLDLFVDKKVLNISVRKATDPSPADEEQIPIDHVGEPVVYRVSQEGVLYPASNASLPSLTPDEPYMNTQQSSNLNKAKTVVEEEDVEEEADEEEEDVPEEEVTCSNCKKQGHMINNCGVPLKPKFQMRLNKHQFYAITLFAPYGDKWRQIRKICTVKLLSARRVQSFRPVREEEAGRLVPAGAGGGARPRAWRHSANAADSAVRAIIGSRFKDRDKFLVMLERGIRLFARMSLPDLYPSSRLAMLVSRMPGRMKRHQEEGAAFMDAVVQEHQENRAADDDKEDLLDVLLRIQREGHLQFPMSIDNIKSAVGVRNEAPHSRNPRIFFHQSMK
uniref:CCHC-type domain-containing protein n=1 Tax=Aegilops tauschii TaxID=37682 RepID=M8BYI3_AEGTA